MKNFISDKVFKGSNFSTDRLPKAEYENCVFERCDFLNGYLDNQNFMECTFNDCNLSNANIAHTTFKEVTFQSCKMMGLKFDECNAFLMDFRFFDSNLNLSTFYGMHLKNQIFKNCKLIAVDFTDSNLTNSLFENSDLDKAIFSNTNLSKVDFTAAYNFKIDPKTNQLKHAKFHLESLPNLLTEYQIKIIS